MKRQQFTISDITGDIGRERLEHYNAWLLDPKRESGKPYPGFNKKIKKEKTSYNIEANKAKQPTKKRKMK